MNTPHPTTPPAPAPMPNPAGHVDDTPLILSRFTTATPDGKPALGTTLRTTWGAFAESLRKRREGQKNGPNVVAARLKPEPNGRVRRLKANVLARTLIALDCETHKTTGEVPPSIAVAVARIEARGWAGAVYSSHNHTAAAPRYRVILPMTSEIQADIPAVEIIADLLGLGGVLDRSKLGASSVFFLPSAAPGRLAEHETVVIDGTAIDAPWLAEAAGALQATREAERARQHADAVTAAEARRAARVAAGLKPNENLIERIRDRLDLEAELLKHGYTKEGRAFLYPKSTTGQPGVYILPGRDGVDRVYSHHADDPLAAGNLPAWCHGVQAVDVVDVLVILDHGKDQKRGLHALATQFGIETKPATKREEPPPHPGYDGPDRGTVDNIHGCSEPEKVTVDNVNGDNGEATPDEINVDNIQLEKPAAASTPPSAIIAEARAATLARFNAKYMVVNENGKATIYQPGFDPALNRRHYVRLTPRDLDILYMNDLVPFKLEGEKIVYKPSSYLWMNARERRQYIDGVTFDPSTTKPKPGILNLWQGFAVTPKRGDWSLMRAHIRDIICCGDPEHDAYLMGWLAQMVQKPNKRAEVAVVLKGLEGVGKGILAHMMLRIMGQHGIAISNAKHLTGNFNGHLRDAVFLFADEAFFAGDRAHVGVLKSIITEPYLTIEAKFQNADQMPNYLHLLMASNEEWVVPASIEARRFFVLVVSDAARGNHEYFAAIWKQMEAGGYAAMLADLLAFDLTRFNPRAVPQTEGLQQQRKLSLPVPEEWWMDCLQRGYVFRSRLGLEAEFGKWREVVSTELLFASYSDFARERHERRPLSREDLGRFMKRMGGKPSRPKRGIIGEHITDEPTTFGSHRVAKAIMGPQPPSYDLGTLSQARAALSDALAGMTIEWEAESEPAP